MADTNKNPRNSENLLFRRLTRLLSGPLVNYRTQTGRRIRRIDLDKYSSRFKSASGQHFKKMAYDPFSNLQANVMAGQARTERYVDFDQMEYTPEIASGLDIYADEMTTSSKLQPLLSIDCPNEEIKQILNSLFYNILNIEFNLFGWSRTMCKYGDMFLYLDIDEDRGIQSVIGLPTSEMERLEGEDKTNPNYVQYQWNSSGMTFENWQVAHFRILGNDPSSGRVDLRYNPMSIEEDYFIPIRGGQSSRVETLPGGSYTGDIDDVKYLRDKLFSALKVPQSYLARGEGGEEDKTTLAQKDIRFARTIQRLQRSLVTEIEKVGIIHLYILGFREDDLVSFKLSLNNPSKLAELQELEQWKTKFETASSATDGFFSKRWLAKKMFGLTDEEFMRNQREMYYDRKFEASLEVVGEMEQAAATGGGDFGGEDALGLDSEEGGLGAVGLESELGADDTEGLGDALGGEPDAVEDGDLLAAPGKRRDKAPRLTPGAKGKVYHPTATDKRTSAGRLKQMKGAYNHETSQNTTRNISPGASGLFGLGKGIYEIEGSNYKEEERKLFEVNQDIKKLILDLKLRNEKDET